MLSLLSRSQQQGVYQLSGLVDGVMREVQESIYRRMRFLELLALLHRLAVTILSSLYS
jgi:hypothetical protein